MQKKTIRLEGSADIIAARQCCREVARQLGFGSADQTRLATAVSEIARNAIQHAGGGVCVVTSQSNQRQKTICVTVEDHGPGIEDIDKALEPGFSTAGGLGTGLPGAKRLVHNLTVRSKPGHTVVTMVMKCRTG